MTIAKDANTFFGAESVQDPYPLYERMRRRLGPPDR